MHTEAHPLVFNRSIKAAHPAQRTAASLSPHRQVGLWPHTALLPPPRRAAPHRCAAPHHLAPEPGPHHPDPLARTPKRWPARRGGLRVIPPTKPRICPWQIPPANLTCVPRLRRQGKGGGDSPGPRDSPRPHVRLAQQNPQARPWGKPIQFGVFSPLAALCRHREVSRGDEGEGRETGSRHALHHRVVLPVQKTLEPELNVRQRRPSASGWEPEQRI
jgi:hypothetical protein